MPVPSPFHALKSYSLCPLLSLFQRYAIKPTVVQSVADMVETSHLLYEEYSEKNFCPKMTLQVHYSPFMMTEDSRTFLLRKRKRTVGTMSVFPDFDESLPLDKIFPVEMRLLRLQGRKMAEVGLLALDGMSKAKGMYGGMGLRDVVRLFSMLRVSIQYAIYHDVTHLVMAVHPRQRELFSYFGFVPVLDDDDHALVEDSPVELLILDMPALMQERPFMMKLLLRGAAESDEFCAMNITESLLSFQEVCPDPREAGDGETLTVRPRIFLGYELENN